ncbi:MAG: aminoacyl-tRNA deacylase [Candidatus Latescibacterota bacterium]
MPAKKLKEYLDSKGVKYMTIRHSPAYTTQEVAQSAHIHGQQMAKVVMVKIKGVMAMAVTAADRMADLAGVMHAAGTSDIMLADEKEFESRFPDVETGAMPPFGNLYGMEVYVDQVLARNREIAFNAGSHTEIIKMSYQDFARLVSPKVYSPRQQEEIIQQV